MTKHSMPPTRAEKYWKKRASEIQATTIERCAQVAETYPHIVMALPNSSIDSVCKAITAEIRALKEKP